MPFHADAMAGAMGETGERVAGAVAAFLIPAAHRVIDRTGRRAELRRGEGDLLAVRSAGAYGFVMSSNYNTRGRPPELMVDGTRVYVVRARESVDDQLRLESGLPS